MVWVQESWQAWHRGPAITEAQNQGFEVAHPYTYPICGLLEHEKGMAPQIQSCRISMTQGNNRISERSPIEGPRLILYQKLEVNLTNDS